MTRDDEGISVMVAVDGQTWTAVRDLGRAGPDDRVFALDRETGRIRFGDGVHGRTPPAGAHLSLLYRERNGDAGQTQITVITRWPPPDSRFVIDLDKQSVRIAPTLACVERFGPAKRNKYFEGQLLTAGDLELEQQYSRDLRRRHNLHLHGWGMVDGLAVTLSETPSPTSIVVATGMAIDRCGRDVVLEQAVTLSLGGPDPTLFVVIEYIERATDPRPVPVPGGDDEPETAMSRIEEGASVCLSADDRSDTDVVLARVVKQGRRWRVDRKWKPKRVFRRA